MQHPRFAVVLSLALCVVAAPCWVQAQEKDVVVEGQVKIGVHKFKLESGTLYQFEVKGKGFSPGVSLSAGILRNTADYVKEANTFRALYFPPKSQEQTLTIIPNFGFGGTPTAGLLDYTLTLKSMQMDEKPVLKKEDELTPKDPKLEHAQIFRKTAFKAYTVKMKAGQTYIIDMVAGKAADNVIDPYLYLEDPMKNIVAADDDGGGFPNARIMYSAPQDGEFRIIATGLSDRSNFGAYTLMVRTVKMPK